MKRTSCRRKHLILSLLLVLVAMETAALPDSAVASLPPNDDFANAQELGSGLPASTSGSNVWATAEPREPSGVERPMASVWYRWTAPQSTLVRVDTCSSNFDTTLAVFRGLALGDLGRVAANNDRCGSKSIVRFFAIAGTTYSIAVDGHRGYYGSIALALDLLKPPANDAFANALNLGRKSTVSTRGTNVDATVEPNEPGHVERGTVATVWYRWTVPANRTIRIDTCGSRLDTIIAIYVGSEVGALSQIARNDDTRRAGKADPCGFGDSRVLLRSFARVTLHIAVAGYGRAEGSFRLNVSRPSRG